MKMPMAMGTTHGGMIKMRNRRWPGKAALSSTAAHTPITILNNTEKNVHTNVRRMMDMKLPLKLIVGVRYWPCGAAASCPGSHLLLISCINFDPNQNIDLQIEKMDALLKDQIPPDQRKKLQYIYLQ